MSRGMGAAEISTGLCARMVECPSFFRVVKTEIRERRWRMCAGGKGMMLLLRSFGLGFF